MNASWVAIDLMEFAVRTEDAVQSPEAALEWLRSFRDTLLMEGRNSKPMPWAVELLGMADVKIAKKSIARMQGQIVKIYGKDCDVDLECSKKYGEKYEKLKNIIAAAATREGVDESTTGCIQSTADAPHREVGDDVTDTGNRALLESGTSAETMGRVAQNEAPAHGFSGGRTAQGTMSRSPEAAAQSGNIYDQKTANTSTNKAPRSQHGAGEVPHDSVSAKPSPALPVPAKRPHGEFGNVLLTDDELAKLQEKTPKAWDLITELDQYIESQGKTKKYKSHYATLLNWSRRKATEAKQPSRYKNINDINRENCEQIERDLRAMFHPEEVI
jgi:hypothetical protein